ncbi:MAG TPA: hypothetical protein VKZ53_17655 [Candidatus Angelobacter sp.]|nr:hypothetical protein [Candidatus Angelobacter sp.]
MKTLTNEAVEWIKNTGLHARSEMVECVNEDWTFNALEEDVVLPEGAGFGFTVRLPQLLAHQLPYFANKFLPGHYGHLEPFLFWITDNGATGELGFNLANRMIAMMREVHGETRPILESPAYLLESSDGDDAHLLVTMAFLFSWGAYLVPHHGRYFVWFDDDEFTTVLCRNQEDYNRLMVQFEEWSPSEIEIHE